MTLKFSSMIRAVLASSVLLASAAAQTAPPAAPVPATGVPSKPVVGLTGLSIGPASQVIAPDRLPFPNGETLHYQAEWRLWPAGIATLKVQQDGNEQRITASASSTGVAAVLFRVADTFVSRFDSHSFCSIVYTKHMEEGLHKRETTIRYDQARRKAVLDERNLRDNSTKHLENDIPGCVTDVLNGIYYPRTLPLQPGATFLFPLNNGGHTVDVKAYVEGREEIKTDIGTFQTMRVSITSDAEQLKGRGKIWIWYTDDATHMPVQMRSRLFWGTLTLRITGLEK